MSLEGLGWLQDWFAAQCNGEWEHSRGVDIGTLDNPGWYISINLVGTDLQQADRELVEMYDSDDDWAVSRIREGNFEGFGDPKKLGYLLDQFRQLMDSKGSEG